MSGGDGAQLVTASDVIELLSRLVSVDSVNPSLVPGAPGEAQIGAYIAEWLEDAGLEVHVEEIAPGRPNVIARVPGRGEGRSLLLNAHMDTVGITGMENPFAPEVQGDRLYGRGAYDMKGGLAAIMLAGREIARRGGADGDIILTAVADEEYASLGTQAVIESWHADAAVVTEPTGLRLCVAHKGFAWVRVKTHGRAAHGSKPDLGVDAIAHMGRVLIDVEALAHELSLGPVHPFLGTGSVHASLIEGGQELSSYPESCVLQIERRTLPGETTQSVGAEIQQRLDARASADPSFHADSDLFFWRDPFEVDLKAAVVEAVREAALRVTGSLPASYGDTPWMDAALLASAGIPTVVFGPGGVGAHSAEEYALVSEVAICAQVLTQSALDFCVAPSTK